jgi:hypothetical protein
MERIVLTIMSELFDETEQEASVRKNVTVRTLIDEILQEFSLLEGRYLLKAHGSDKPLDNDKTINDLGIQTGAQLVFERERARLSQQIVSRGGQFFQGITAPQLLALREQDTGTEFLVRWQPAIIGRPSANNPASGEALAVNLGDLAEARTISRQHAQITEYAGRYFVEGLAEQNSTFLNEDELLPGEKRALEKGDKIRVGRVTLLVEFQPR